MCRYIRALLNDGNNSSFSTARPDLGNEQRTVSVLP